MVSKRLGKGGPSRTWCNVLRNVAEGVMFLVDLWRNVLITYLVVRKTNRYPLEHCAVLVPGYLGLVPHQGIRMQNSISGCH